MRAPISCRGDQENSLGCVVGESLGLPHIGRVGAGGRQDGTGGGRERIKLGSSVFMSDREGRSGSQVTSAPL